MELGRRVALDSHGSVVYAEGKGGEESEMELKRVRGVGAYTWRSGWSKEEGLFLVVVTTHRLLLFPSEEVNGRGVEWPLAWVGEREEENPGLFEFTAHPKAVVAFSRPAVLPGSAGVAARAAKAGRMRLSFHGGRGDRDSFLAFLNKAVADKRWEAKAFDVHEAASAHVGGSGIGGITHHRLVDRAEREIAKKLTEEGMSDIRHLVREAGKIAAIMKAHAARLEKERGSGKRGGGEGEGVGLGVGEEDEGRLQRTAEQIGVLNPVRKDGGGNSSAFHRELSRQLASFSERLVESAGGMLLLSDLYCLYNRARGTDLVSPEDVLAACRLMPELGLRFKLAAVGKDGALVLRSAKFDPAAMHERLLRLLATQKDFTSPAKLATQWKISLTIATEYLLSAEKDAIVCRDDSVHGIRFYKTPQKWRGAKPSTA